MACSPCDRLAVALDVPTGAAAQHLVERLRPSVGVFKVGLELFTREGPRAVERVRTAGRACFLDLKLHDVPNTVERAVEAASDLGVTYLTVHAACGPEALTRAARAAERGGVRLLAVTVLTSLDAQSLRAIGVAREPEDVVRDLAKVAVDAGVTGIVASVHECRELRQVYGARLLLVTPGIRPDGVSADDQRRTATPREALAAGADLLVVGRPIRNASDPAAAAEALAAAIAEAGR